jgi:Na+-transporting NADH:ubiquinone oxidoreductase subunit NqrE
MSTEQNNDELLQRLFSEMKEEKLPETFRADVMKQVLLETAKIKKRNEFLGLLSVILASLAIIALAVLAFIYMGMTKDMAMPKVVMPKFDLSIVYFYSFIGLIALLLLFMDYQFRRIFRKKHPL